MEGGRLTSDDERSENSSNFRENSAPTVTEARVVGVGYMGPRYHSALAAMPPSVHVQAQSKAPAT
jgi:hypothetical protein